MAEEKEDLDVYLHLKKEKKLEHVMAEENEQTVMFTSICRKTESVRKRNGRGKRAGSNVYLHL